MLPDDTVLVNITGKYYIGDPCYCFSNDNTWGNLCNSWFGLNESPIAVSENVEVVGFSTAYGDGNYAGYIGSKRHDFPVDAGMLGVVPESFIEIESSFVDTERLGVIVELSAGDIIRSIGGDFYISGSVDVNIITRDDVDDDYDEDDYRDDRHDTDEHIFDSNDY